VIDHGQGVVSVLQHLALVAVGRSGQSGIAPEPMLQWRV
jgi:hypothetical protein